VGERLLDHDQEAQLRRPALDGTRLEQLGIVDHRRPAVYAEGVADAWDQEEERDPGVGQQVGERVGEPVPGPFGDEQRPLVEDPGEAGRIAARRDVQAAVGAAGRDTDERRALDELPRERRQVVGRLCSDEVLRRADDLAQVRLGGDRGDASSVGPRPPIRPR
jgi:hypothetical protein